MTNGGSASNEAISFQGKSQPRRLAYWAPNLLYLAIPLVIWALRGQAGEKIVPDWVVVVACLGVGAVWYYRAIEGRSVTVRLDATSLVAPGHQFSLSGLTTEWYRWVEPSLGTTVGSALVLRHGKETLAIGCKGSAPAEEGGVIPSVHDVRIILPADAFHELSAALRRDSGAAAASSGVLIINLVPAPTSARGFARSHFPFFVMLAVVSGVGALLPNQLALLKNFPRVSSWGLAGLGAVVMLLFINRPPRTRYRLRVEANTIACLDAHTSRVLGRCPVRELAVARGRHVVGGRFGRFTQPVLTLRWPAGPKVYLGLAEFGGHADRELPRRWLSPSLLVGRSEWEALTRALHG